MLLLERRLDNMIYRLGFANSRAEARQLVRHGHFLVNGRKVEHSVGPGARPATSSRCASAATRSIRIQEALELSQRRGVPEWLEVDNANFTGAHQGAAGPHRSDDADQREAGRRAVLEVRRARRLEL